MEPIRYLQPKTGMTMLEAPHPLLFIDAAVNPYAGCSYRCRYCPSAGAGRVGIKTNLLHLLRKELSTADRQLHIGLGTDCEPYCRQEMGYNITRYAIEMIIGYGMPLQIFTKSSLILRDIDLLKPYSEQGLLAVTVSLCTLDGPLAKSLEPDAPAPGERIELLNTLDKAGIFAGIMLAPVIPALTDSPAHLRDVFKAAKAVRAKYVVPSVLAMEHDQVRANLRESFPRNPSYADMEQIYADSALPFVGYTGMMTNIFCELSAAYDMPLHPLLHEKECREINISRALVAR